MRTPILFILLLITTFLPLSELFAQTSFELPQNIQLKTKEDYVKYELTVVEAANWLQSTDLDKEKDKRMKIEAFVVQWTLGSPTVNIPLTGSLADLYGKNVSLVPTYLAGYAKNYIENKSTANHESATRAGIAAMIVVYKKGIEIQKSREMEKVIKMDDDQFSRYLQKKFNIVRTIAG